MSRACFIVVLVCCTLVTLQPIASSHHTIECYVEYCVILPGMSSVMVATTFFLTTHCLSIGPQSPIYPSLSAVGPRRGARALKEKHTFTSLRYFKKRFYRTKSVPRTVSHKLKQKTSTICFAM